MAKAFDSINHDLLWFKLSTIGLSTKMLEILQHMYSNARSVVSYDGYTSREFECQKGVRQGCPLSPLLFSLFVSDLEDTLKSTSSGKIRIGEQDITIVMFADDLVLLADSSDGLRQSLSVLQDYCRTWHLTINAEKTKVMICSNVSPSAHFSFYINDTEIEITPSINYLGLVLTSNGSMTSAISSLTNQARKAVFALLKKITYLDFPPPFLMCRLFDALVTPVLEYGCQIWDFQARNNKEIEVLHRKFCKFILNVPASATNIGIYLWGIRKKTNAVEKKFIVD